MSNPTRQQRRQLLRERRLEAEVASEMSRERRIGEDVHWQGVGELVLQIIELPSFVQGYVWDVREVDDGLKLYVSFTNSEREGFLRPGYDRLDIESNDLRSMLGRLTRISVEQLLPANPMAGLDGTRFSLTLRGGFSSVSFSWWEEGPPEWSSLTHAVRELVPKLRQLSNSALQPSAALTKRQ
jgi:hypothetical protein